MPPSKEPILDWIPPDPGLDFFVDDGELFDLPDAADAEVDFLSAAIRTPEIRSSSFLRFSSSRSLLRISWGMSHFGSESSTLNLGNGYRLLSYSYKTVA